MIKGNEIVVLAIGTIYTFIVAFLASAPQQGVSVPPLVGLVLVALTPTLAYLLNRLDAVGSHVVAIKTEQPIAVGATRNYEAMEVMATALAAEASDERAEYESDLRRLDPNKR